MKKVPRTTLTAPIRKVRFVCVALVFCVWIAAIGVRLTWLQVVRHAQYVERARYQQHQAFDVAPRRGVLYDRNLRELAMTMQLDSVYSVPSQLTESKADDAAKLARIVHTDPQDNFTSEAAILARLNGARNFAWVARKISADDAAKINGLKLKGIYLQKEFKRYYPNNSMAAQVLGFVGADDAGLGGLERRYDSELHGEPGHVLIAFDAHHHAMSSEGNQPDPGENLVLSIDTNIQYIAEHALDAQIAKTKAAHGTVVVQDPRTGQILALAVYPRSNLNDPKHMDAGSLKNLAVSDVYEPGSTFKLVTYAAAIDAAGVEPTDTVDCQNGALTMYGRTLHDDKSDGKLGRVTVQYALERSSDVGAAKMALKLGNQRFYDYIKAFGFGERTGIELPSETRGLLQRPQRWGPTSILSIAIGQEVGVTPIQLVSMVSTIANGGVYMPPHILLQSTDAMKGDARLKPMAFHPTTQLPNPLPEGSRRVIKELTAAKMRSMMQGIVTEGTGKAAQLNGYSSAGKTGTANKVDPATHTYSHTKLVASFAGFAPVSAPAISVTVVIDTPTVGSLYGAAVSAPVFHDVAQQVLEYLGVPHDEQLKTTRQMLLATRQTGPEEMPTEHADDMTALFDAVNSLPADDPLRQPATAAAMQANVEADRVAESNVAVEAARRAAVDDRGVKSLPDKVLAKFRANGGTNSVMPDAATGNRPLVASAVAPIVVPHAPGSVVVDAGRRIRVPSFNGMPLRGVVQQAGSSGLRVQTMGNGLAREQVPAAGTMVALGTEIVVRFAR